jgi:hypothetical protein
VVALLLSTLSFSVAAQGLTKTQLIDLFNNGLFPQTFSTEAAVRQKFGVPVDVTTEQVQNRHEPTRYDIVTAIKYPGLHFRFYTSRSPDNPWKNLALVSVFGPEHKLKHKLRIGSRKAEIRALFRRAYENQWVSEARWEDVGQESISYSWNDYVEAVGEIVFVFRQGVVEKINWYPLPD